MSVVNSVSPAPRFLAAVVLVVVAACATKPPPRPPPSAPPVDLAAIGHALQGQSCGRAEGSPVVRQKWAHGASDLCDAAQTTWSNVVHQDRTCASDADCVVVTGSCFVDALNRAARAKPKYAQLPCTNPAAGECLPWDADARCKAGCCTAERR